MEEEVKEFSWASLFLVTSICFFAFTLFLKIFEGANPGIFLWVGVSTLFLGLITGAGNWLNSIPEKNSSS